jgi:transcriptional regulator with XRE-family HTH domain
MADPVFAAKVADGKRAFDDALALQELQERRGATQRDVARELGVSQPNVWRIEHAQDTYLSSLREYVVALGGRLELRVVFPDETITVLAPGDEACEAVAESEPEVSSDDASRMRAEA